MKRKRLIYNTALMTGASLLMSLISMTFQVWLAGRIGADGIGLYQLVLSVTFLAATFAISGIRFAATRLVSEELGLGRRGGAYAATGKCFAYSLLFGISAGLILWFCAEPIGFLWIGDARTVRALKISALSMPLISLCAVISGYFTACGRVWKPTLTHLVEQLATVGLVAFFLSHTPQGDIEKCCCSVMLGTVCGDALSLVLMLIFYFTDAGVRKKSAVGAHLTSRMLKIALPLAFSAYARSALSTLQHLLVPKGLRASGLSSNKALSDYGTVSGMVMPVIAFPACVLTALSELIVPELTAAQVNEDTEEISRISKGIIKKGLGYSAAVALFMFVFAGKLGIVIYDSPEAGHFIRLISPLIPVMYTDVLIDGCLKGLGQQVWSMGINILDAMLGVILTWKLLPLYAMSAYIGIIYFSECLNFALSLWRLRQIMPARTRNSSTKVTSTATANRVKPRENLPF
ncbi:MAG: MATE family efflux transporter [Bacillota bacterium]|nr:MATE family efflux transporter [Bacillota bacterium]